MIDPRLAVKSARDEHGIALFHDVAATFTINTKSAGTVSRSVAVILIGEELR
jgi:hypothetical protein